MKVNLLSLAVLAAFSVGQTQAHDLTTSSPGVQHALDPDAEYATIYSAAGSGYNDDYFFTLDNTYFISVSAVINSRSKSIDPTANMISLYSYDAVMGSMLEGSFTYGETSVDHDFGDMAAGTYFYQLSGTNSGAYSNQNALQSYATAVIAVPEPETYAMMLAGLGVMGLIARRRKAV